MQPWNREATMREIQLVLRQAVSLLRWAGPACAHIFQAFVTAAVTGKGHCSEVHPLACWQRFPGPACSAL